jgi:hypothetical protein
MEWYQYRSAVFVDRLMVEHYARLLSLRYNPNLRAVELILESDRVAE